VTVTVRVNMGQDRGRQRERERERERERDLTLRWRRVTWHRPYLERSKGLDPDDVNNKHTKANIAE